jgi:hypothetical protein
MPEVELENSRGMFRLALFLGLPTTWLPLHDAQCERHISSIIVICPRSMDLRILWTSIETLLPRVR